MLSNMLEYLEATAARVPERVAFYDEREALTFRGLLETARRIGTALAAAAKPRSPVALLLDSRSIRNIPAMYGVLCAGCAYAPLDIAMPPERLAQLLTLLAPAAVLADGPGEKALVASGYKDAAFFRYDSAAGASCDPALLAAIRRGTNSYDPMSILYTSGSTGIPKGSIQTHLGYIHWTEATIAAYNMDESVVFGNQSPFFYANSIIDIFPPVALGATVYLLPAGVLAFPSKLIDALNAHRVTELTMTPFSFISVVNSGALTPGCLPELRYGIMSGESMPWEPLKVWMDATPAATWWHLYGSTEMFTVAVGRVEGPPPEDERLPVGRPFPMTHILFVDENGVEVPAGTPGEMLLSSPYVSVGYHRDEARTEGSWVVDPLDRGWYERFYRAGDLGYIRPDGQLVVLGRQDTQIKHMGYRMELGEVEAALRSVDGWQDGCVMYHRASDRIWCFFTGQMDEKFLRKSIKGRLAKYMMPDVYVRLDEMPHTPTMKLDRAALAAMMERQGE